MKDIYINKKVYLKLTLFNGNVFYIQDGEQDKLYPAFKEQIKDVEFLSKDEYLKRSWNFGN